MIKAIIFDFGGVITPIEPWDNWEPTEDERTVIRSAIKEIAEKFSFELINNGFAISDFKREFKLKTKRLKKESVQRIINSLCTPNETLLDLISKLSLKYKIYGLVNAPFGWTEIRRGIHNLDKYFSRTFVSYEIDVRKPDPRIFYFLLENTGLIPEECVFVDDKEENVSAAIKLGMQGYMFKSSKGFADYLMTLGLKIE